MDLLNEVLKSIRLEGSLFFNSRLTAPWDLALSPSKRPRFHLVLDGRIWLQTSALAQPVCLTRGDAVFLSDGGAHSLVHAPRASVPEAAPAEACHLVCGTFGFDDELRHPLVDALPECVRLSVIADQPALWAMAQLMVEELDRETAGAEVVIDRLCELFLINVLRKQALETPDVPGFVTALEDSHTRKAIQLIHAQPEINWTLERLAQAVGLSRSAFAKRFHELVGVPPKTYLTTWRMHIARRLLKNPYARLATVAQQTGYSSDTAFNRAFKQFFGKSPGAYQTELTQQ